MNRLSLLVGLTIFNATMVAGAELGSEARAARVHVGRATTSALLCGLNVNIRRKVEVTGDLDEKSPDEYSEGFDAGVAATADQGKLGKGPFCQREVALYGAEGSAVKGLLVTKEWKPISTFPLSDQDKDFGGRRGEAEGLQFALCRGSRRIMPGHRYANASIRFKWTPTARKTQIHSPAFGTQHKMTFVI
jgi:hypothetical protein